MAAYRPRSGPPVSPPVDIMCLLGRKRGFEFPIRRRKASPIWLESWSGDDREPDFMDFNLFVPGGRFQENQCEPVDREFGFVSHWSAASHAWIYDTHSIEAAVGPVDPRNRDFRLTEDSPARGSGIDRQDMGAYPRRDNTAVGRLRGNRVSDENGECFPFLEPTPTDVSPSP